MSIKWIFFDVGSTLVDENGSHRVRFADAAKEIKKVCGKDISYDEFCILMNEGAEKRERSPFHYALKKFGVTKKYAYSNEGETLYPEAKETVEQIKSEYNIGIIANQPKGLSLRIKEFGLLGYIDAVFGSDDVGYKKPDVDFYRYALKETDCRPDEAVMIGDRLDNDIMPAKKAGMKTIRIMQGFFKAAAPETEDETPDYSAESLIDIPKILSILQNR